MTSVLTASPSASPADLATLVAINLVAISCAAGIFFLLRATLWSVRRAVSSQGLSPATVILGSFAMGAVKALVTVALSSLFLGERLDPLAGRMLSAGMLAIVTISTLSALLHQLEVYRSERAILIDELVRREMSPHPDPTGSTAVAMTALVEQTLETIRAADPTPEGLASALDSIREDRIRPLSHAIWKRESTRLPEFRIRTLLGLSLSSLRFPVIPALVVFAVIAATRFISALGWVNGTQVLLADLALLAIAIGAMRLLPQRGIVWGTSAFTLVSAACAYGMTWLARLIAPAYESPSPVVEGVALWLLIVTVTIAVGVLSLIRQNSKTVRAELLRANPELLSGDLIGARAAINDRATARLLHSEVQNVFLSRAVQIRTFAADAGHGPDATTGFLAQQVDEITAYLIALNERPRQTDLGGLEITDTLDHSRRIWAGVAEITFHVAVASALIADERAALKEILEEGISNSVKHGLARNVKISVTDNQDVLEIIIVDDGIGPRGGPPGLGTNLLNAFATGGWQLVASTELGGARLVARRRMTT